VNVEERKLDQGSTALGIQRSSENVRYLNKGLICPRSSRVTVKQVFRFGSPNAKNDSCVTLGRAALSEQAYQKGISVLASRRNLFLSQILKFCNEAILSAA